MKTKGDCLNLFLRYLDEATKKGVALPITKNADYRDKFSYFLNEAQTYIATLIKIPALFTVTQNPIPNLLGLFQGFDMVQYLPGMPKILTATGAKSFYLELDNVGTVLIKVNNVLVQTIDNTIKRQFTVYKANTGATSTDIVTIEFQGLYPYNIRNTGLYGYAFPTDEDVPDYTAFQTYDMPSNFMSFDNVMLKSDPRSYEAYLNYKWEATKKIVLGNGDKGSFDIHYFAYPTTILPTDLDTVLMSVEDKAIDLVVLQAGIMATAADNPSLSSWLRSLYIEKVQNVTQNSQVSDTVVQTIYSMV
ncbi:MAG TPA: hypothetical protein VIK78_14695 [Ruminiclostridium sp.]